MPKRRILLATLLAALHAGHASADLVVVANPKSGIERMTKEEVIFVFLGRWRQLPSGLPAKPVDSPVDSSEHDAFYRQLVNKDSADIKAYWSRLMFSGSTRPPISTQSREEQIKVLASTPGAIGYMERSATDSRIKIVFEFLGSAP